MEAVTPADIRLIHRAVMDAGRSSSTARKTHMVLSGMFETAYREGLTHRNVVKLVDAPKAAVSNRGAMTSAAALKLLEVGSQSPDGIRWWLALLCGMRQGERLGATIDSVDFRTGTFTVGWSLTTARSEHGCSGECEAKKPGLCPKRMLVIPDGLEYRELNGSNILVRPKSGKPRSFPLIPQMASVLERYLDTTQDTANPYGLILRQESGMPIDSKQDSKAWSKLLVDAGIAEEYPDATGHWARHTTATLLMELGVDRRVIGEIIGHASEEITMRYQHVSSDAARDAMSRLGGLLLHSLEK